MVIVNLVVGRLNCCCFLVVMRLERFMAKFLVFEWLSALLVVSLSGWIIGWMAGYYDGWWFGGW